MKETVLLARPQETLVHREESHSTTRNVIERGKQNRHDPGERNENNLGFLHLGPRRLEEDTRQQGIHSIGEVAQNAQFGGVLFMNQRTNRDVLVNDGIAQQVVDTSDNEGNGRGALHHAHQNMHECKKVVAEAVLYHISSIQYVCLHIIH